MNAWREMLSEVPLGKAPDTPQRVYPFIHKRVKEWDAILREMDPDYEYDYFLFDHAYAGMSPMRRRYFDALHAMLGHNPRMYWFSQSRHRTACEAAMTRFAWKKYQAEAANRIELPTGFES